MEVGGRKAEPIEVPMADGVSLAALRIPGPGPRGPAIVRISAYRKEPLAQLFDERALRDLGCDVIVAESRGVGASGGEWNGPLSPQEIADGVELLAWIAAQDFCTGETALVGGSYLAATALLVAARKPPSLRCVVAMVPPTDLYRDWLRRGGIPSHTSWGANVASSNEGRPDVQRRILADYYLETQFDPFDRERTRAGSAEYVLGDIEVPTLVVGGAYDFFLRGAVRAFEGLRVPKRLVVGNWGHGGSAVAPEWLDEPTRWVASWVRGGDGEPAPGGVLIQDSGTDEWASSDGWPTEPEIAWERWSPVGEPTDVPLGVGFAPCLTVSPLRLLENMSTASGQAVWGEVWTADRPPVDAPTAYWGPVALHAVLSSPEATDLDLHARVSIVRADGSLHQISEGRLRASHRAVDRARSVVTAGDEVVVPWHPHDRAEPLSRDEPAALDVEIFPIHLTLMPGESLRLGLALLRSDGTVAAAHATLLPETTVLLPGRGTADVQSSSLATSS